MGISLRMPCWKGNTKELAHGKACHGNIVKLKITPMKSPTKIVVIPKSLNDVGIPSIEQSSTQTYSRGNYLDLHPAS